tara:strand:- start:1589 stop:2419 length:831 start_codon:yes stop_codon:yes gene_type:complete
MSSIVVKDAAAVDKYFQTIESGLVGNPFQSVVPEFRIAAAINQILGDDAVDVSIWEKAKTLTKFGVNPDLDSGTSETIWGTGGSETLATTNGIDIIVSTAIGDTQDVVIEGHTLSGTDLTFVVQTATLNGTTNVTLGTPLARVSRAYNNGATDLAGDITIEDNGTSVNLTILGTLGENNSEKCATSTSQFDYWIITELCGGVIGTVAATVEFKLQFKRWGKVWRTAYEFNSDGFQHIQLNPCIIIPPNTDVRIVGTSNTNNTEAVADIRGHLAIIT